MAQERRFVGQTHASNLRPPVPDFEDYFDHVIEVTLRLNAAWDRQAHQIELGVSAEHQRTNLDGANPAFQIELICQRNAGELIDE